MEGEGGGTDRSASPVILIYVLCNMSHYVSCACCIGLFGEVTEDEFKEQERRMIAVCVSCM